MYPCYNIPLNLKESFQDNIASIFTNNCLNNICAQIDNTGTNINDILSEITDMLKSAGKYFEKKPKTKW